MEEILKKNLINIAMHNKSLCDKILSVRELSKQFEISSNLAGEYNLLINGKPVHSITDINKESENLFTEILRRLTDDGNTVIVIEHNLDVIKTAWDILLWRTDAYTAIREQDMEVRPLCREYRIHAIRSLLI